MEERSIKHRCCGKSIIITHRANVSTVSYPLLQAHAPYCIVICGLSASTIFFAHYLIKGTIFEINKVIEHKMRVLIFSVTFVCNTSHSKKIWGRYH